MKGCPARTGLRIYLMEPGLLIAQLFQVRYKVKAGFKVK
jgi:hypothetical protein